MQKIIPGKNLMIVAHPDDEVLFGFQQLLFGCWHVICVTNESNHRRSAEFKEVITLLGQTGEIWDFKDEWRGFFERDILLGRLEEVVNKNFDHVLTHGPEGEYGHSQHIELHNAVKSLVEKNLFVFDKGENILPFDILRKKIEILQLYKSQIECGLFDLNIPMNRKSSMMTFVVHESLKKFS